MINLDAALHVLMEAEQGRYLTLFSFLVAKDLDSWTDAHPSRGGRGDRSAHDR